MVWSWQILIKIALSMLFGGIIGLEREFQRKPAGLRTIMLVCLAAAIFVIGAREASLALGEEVNATRAMNAIASGIGFLGAGIILQQRGEIKGITTAATLWTAAAIGYAVGIGQYILAALATLSVYAILHWVEKLALYGRVRRPDDPPSETD